MERLYIIMTPHVIKFEGGCIVLIDNGYSEQFAGGIRVKQFASDNDAVEECTNLAYSMFKKNKKANIKFGGCKIMLNVDTISKQNAIYNLATFLINSTRRIIVGNDLNFTNEDLYLLRDYMMKMDSKNINIPLVLDDKISISTAYGICGGIISLNIKTVLLQGIGNVGKVLLDLLVNNGIHVHVFDVNTSKYKDNDNIGITYYHNFDDFIRTPADVFSPCADGRILNQENINKLNVKYILGSANNQLDCPVDIIDDKGIIYVPDYIVNVGGVFCATQISQNYNFSNEMVYEKIFATTQNYIQNKLLLTKIVKQYDSEESQEFYSVLMGDSLKTGSIHYGIYSNDNNDIDDTVNIDVASKKTIHELIKDVDLNGKRILDIGSGNGYTSHYLASLYNCEITCVNICPNQNKKNRETIERLGFQNRITVFDYDFSDIYWSNEFDIVISQEAICHAHNSSEVFNCIFHALKPGGVFIFSDLLSSGKLSAFNNVNSINKLSLLNDVYDNLNISGFKIHNYTDNSKYLHTNFLKMKKQLETNYKYLEPLMGKQYIDDFIDSLNMRLDTHNMIWGFFKCEKRTSNTIYTTFKLQSEWIEKYNGINFDWYKQDKFMDANELEAVPINNYLIVNIMDKVKTYDKPVIATVSSGKEHLKNVSCQKICVKDTITESVVDYLIGIILMTDRNLHSLTNNKEDGFNYNTFYNCSYGTHMRSKTIGIIGMGKIGQRITHILKNGWGCNIIYYSPTNTNANGATYMSLRDVLSNADVILPLCELNEHTENLLNYDTLSLTKRGVVIVSICRSKIINFIDILRLLEEQHFKTLVFDDINESVRNLLTQYNNVLITNHIAYNTTNSIRDSFLEVLDELIRRI